MLDTVASNAGRGPAERLDPYWTVAWPADVGGITTAWGGKHFDRMVACGGSRDALRSLVRVDREAIDAMLAVSSSRASLELLAALAAWHTMTDHQLATLSGHSVVGRNGRLLPRLVDTGLVQVGRLYDATGTRVPVTMLRLDPNGQFGYLEKQVSWSERLATTGAQPWRRALPTDRHNILSTELSLRAAELSPVAVVVGESFARLSDLFGPTAKCAGKRRGDAVWYRSDGLRIVLEMVASTTTSAPLTRKLETWANLLSEPTGAGTVVLFAAAVDRGRGWHASVSQLRTAVERAAYSSMSTVAARVAERMAVVAWADWFPAAGQMSRTFPTLTAWVPSGPSGDRWQPIDLADPFQAVMPAELTDRATRCVDDARVLWSIPVWQRDRGDRLAEMVTEAVGLGDLYRRRRARAA